MYDLADLAAANDAVWQVVARRLRVAGVVDVPDRLVRDRSLAGLWEDPRLLLAQACGYPLLTSLAGKVRLVATPRYRAPGCAGTRYGSALVVGVDDPSPDLAAFGGRVCAANQPHSNTGMNLIRAAVAEVAGGRPFFRRVLWTGSHRGSLALVAAGEADLAAIDLVTLAHLRRLEPDLTDRVRILVTSGATDDATLALLRAALDEIGSAPAHAGLRDRLLIDGFDPVPVEDYDEVMALERRAVALGYPTLA
jgi:ABC-type phosphate/phosphonate transport system substrate-binding protein